MFSTQFSSPDNPRNAALVGAAIGILGGVLALLIVLLEPVMAFGLVIGLAVGLYVLTDLHGALYVMIGVIALLPFGTLPFEIAVTPTLLDAALGGFLLVYAMQWMTGQRRLFRATPVTPLVLGFILLMIFAFLMGLRHAPMTPRVLRNVLEMVLSLLLIPVLVDVMRDAQHIRRAVVALALWGAAAAVVGIVLWLLPDFTAESILNRLGRLGYPVGGVIRYRQTSGAILNERAIGTWVDPNAFGGFLLMLGALIVPQIFTPRPIMRRPLAAALFGLIAVALFLTDSRGSMLSLGAALAFIAVLRYPKLLLIMLLVVIIAFFLPFTQRYIDKLAAGLSGEDVETQMRFGEYRDALRLIGRHPVIGVGFSGTPEIDLYLGVANTYLTIASHAGFVGLAAYLLMFGGAFAYSFRHLRRIQADLDLSDVWLGLAAALAGALVGGMFDHFYFKIDQFHAPMTIVWILFGLMLAATRLAADSSTPARTGE
ncbi:MAG: O-antigen ligase family protein [Chloroflexi bacterium]|nr:O-antigen ligase family protein [Chloroflexota bacterium]